MTCAESKAAVMAEAERDAMTARGCASRAECGQRTQVVPTDGTGAMTPVRAIPPSLMPKMGVE
jgi:hypothetical protein